MKNPMTLEEMKQALDDNAAGHDMELRPIGSTADRWSPRVHSAGEPLNFRDYEYRRKPELIEKFVNIYKDGSQSIWDQYKYAQKQAKTAENYIRMVRLVEDPTWAEPEPKKKNPWRPIIKGEWPECGPVKLIEMKFENGSTHFYTAGGVNWHIVTAIEWRYAEADEIRQSKD